MNGRTVWTVADAERRRIQHKYGASRRKQALVLLGAAVLLPVLWSILVSAHGIGRAVAAGETAFRTLARWYLPGSVVLFVVVGATNAGRRVLGFGARPLLLTTVPTRELVYGLLLAELLASGVGLLGPGVVLVGAFALGAGSPVTFVVGSLALVALVVAGGLLGMVVGLVGRLALRRVPLDPETRSLLSTVVGVGGALAAGLVGAYAGATGATAEDVGLEAITPSGPPPVPLGYYADWLFVGTPLFEGPSLAAVGSLAVVVLALPLGVAGVARIAPRIWYADPALPDPEPTAESTGSAGPTDPVRRAPWLEDWLGVVAGGLLRRGIRTPGRYAHVAYYLLLVGLLVAGGIVNPEAFWFVLGGSTVLLGIWLAGGAFGLNPLGEEGAMLGQLVLSATPPRAFVRGRIVAGLAVGLPLVLAGTAAMVVGGLAPTDAPVLAGYWGLLTVVSATAAVGFGTLYPRTEPGSVLDGIETVPPETLVLAVHAVLTLVLAAVGALLLVSPPDSPLRLGGLATIALVFVLLGDGGYRFAVGGFADHGRARRPDRRFTVELVVGLALLSTVTASTVGFAVQSFLPWEGLVGFVIAFVGGYVGMAAVVVAYVLGADRAWSFLRVRVPSRSDLRVLALGLLASFGLYGLLVAGVLFADLPLVQHSLGEQLADGGPAFALALVVLALLVNGPVEELLYRGVLQQRLAEVFHQRVAVAGAAVVFALAHLPVYADGTPTAVGITLTSLVLLGSVWGWVFARTDSVVPAALCHGIYNAALFGIAYVSLL